MFINREALTFCQLYSDRQVQWCRKTRVLELFVNYHTTGKLSKGTSLTHPSDPTVISVQTYTLFVKG